MCAVRDEVGIRVPSETAKDKEYRLQTTDILSCARAVASWRENRDSHIGFVGHGNTKVGDRILIAVDREYDPAVPESIACALREKGAHVDILIADLGDREREFDYLDEVRVTMRREPWDKNPRRWEGVPYIEEFADRRGYDLLIHGKGGPIPKTEYRYEQIPWLQSEHFLQRATTYPLDLHLLINEKTWEMIWEAGRGGKAHLTDAEGTNLSWTYWDEYFDGSRYGFCSTPRNGHLFGHPVPPIIHKEDATGVVAGTTTHFSRAFPLIKAELEAGQIVKISGGGQYGDAWRDLLQESKNTLYPCFPRPVLFYLWEVAIGTNPKIVRPSYIERHSSGGFEWERRRSGIIHMGFGTMWRSDEERWAGEKGLLYGHLHIHLLFPTLIVIAKDGKEYPVIQHGHLTALDNRDVRKLASKYGDPDEILKEDWIAPIPGISILGSYEEYAREPDKWIYKRRDGRSIF